MPDTPQSLAGDLSQQNTRFRFPRRPIFLCGGLIRTDDKASSPSLRDYLIRLRKIEPRLADKVVLAERANQLFLKTTYQSLIRFEEDIAMLSGLVVLIAESPGSLAELGSFEASKTIRRRLRVLIQDRFEDDESFIRNGPILQLMADNDDSVAFLPWKVNNAGSIIKTSISADIDDIVSYINDEYNTSPKSQRLGITAVRKRQFFYLYWIVHLCGGRSPTAIYEIFRSIYPDAKDADLRNMLFCLELLGWIGRVRYISKEYFFALHDDDPFQYRFKAGVANTNATARKQEAYEWVENKYPVDRRAKRRILKRRKELVG